MTITRRNFLSGALSAATVAASGVLSAEEKIQGFNETETSIDAASVWQPKSDRKIRMGIVGHGVCKFGVQFSLQNHPNVEIVAVSDLFPDRCAEMAQICHCDKTYPSLEEMIKDDSIEAIFAATDPPNHADHCIKILRSGKHAATAVPAVFGNLEDADRLYEAVKETGLNYMMFETTAYRDGVYAARELYRAGLFGKMLYTEGEYFHYSRVPIGSYKGWRNGNPPQWYPTHSNGFYTCVTEHSFTEVSCFGAVTDPKVYDLSNSLYGSDFGTEIALFKTSEGGIARMAVSWGAPGHSGETGRNRGEYGSYWNDTYQTEVPGYLERAQSVNLIKPALPPGVEAGGHGGSHGYLGNEFVESILENRRPLVDISMALNTTVAGIVAHQSAMRDGELLKIPQFVPLK